MISHLYLVGSGTFETLKWGVKSTVSCASENLFGLTNSLDKYLAEAQFPQTTTPIFAIKETKPCGGVSRAVMYFCILSASFPFSLTFQRQHSGPLHLLVPYPSHISHIKSGSSPTLNKLYFKVVWNTSRFVSSRDNESMVLKPIQIHFLELFTMPVITIGDASNKL